MSGFVDLWDRKFGRLTAQKDGRRNTRSGRAIVTWRCQCDCGNVVTIDSCHLTSGRTQSCGCLNAELKSRRITHGRTGTPENRTWKAMIRRCHNPAVCNYKFYGGRGVSVCDRWRHGEDGKGGFECFFADMGQRPNGTTIDRIDNEGNYRPGNCRWATQIEQIHNSRRYK